MPKGKRDLVKYTDYFTLEVPGSIVQILIIIGMGLLFGIISTFIVHYNSALKPLYLVLYGASSGVLVISVPALLTALLIKAMKRSMKLKHALFAILVITFFYSLFIVASAALYSLTGDTRLAFVVLLLGNAGAYGYWLFINKLAVGQKKGAILSAAIQPVLNILFYIPLGNYILSFGIPVGTALVKLYAGMVVFLCVGYLALYLIDRPAKRELEISSVALFGAMVGQLLYDFTKDTMVLGRGGVKRDIEIDVAVMKGRKYKAIFVKPDLHYGPFSSIGGSVVTELLGQQITNAYGATPFVLHGAVNIDDNPISTSQVSAMSKRIMEYIAGMRDGDFERCTGRISNGASGSCRSINIRLNGLNLLVLSRAPRVTEDIDRNVGMHLERIADIREGERTILIDAHNSRYESAPKDELRGIYKGSRYIRQYENAIREAVSKEGSAPVSFGSAARRFSVLLKEKRDLGSGYTSVGVFQCGGRKLCLIYFDANNMLPGFREKIVRHVRRRYGMETELCTTDTHSVNTLAQPASNSLGRHTSAAEILDMLDGMIDDAIRQISPVKIAYGSIKIEDFKTWGPGSQELIEKVGGDIVRISKIAIPFLTVCGFIIAAWIIYVV